MIEEKAKELGLPVRNEQITVSGEGQTLEVRVNYGVDIEIPGIERVVYTSSLSTIGPLFACFKNSDW